MPVELRERHKDELSEKRLISDVQSLARSPVRSFITGTTSVFYVDCKDASFAINSPSTPSASVKIRLGDEFGTVYIIRHAERAGVQEMS